MLIAARNSFFMGGAKPWTNPYVTDGLVAMWDGEWNAGGGVHDATATTLAGVVGNATFSIPASGYSWGDKWLSSSNGGTATLSAQTPFIQAEIVASFRATGSVAIIIGGNSDSYTIGRSRWLALRGSSQINFTAKGKYIPNISTNTIHAYYIVWPSADYTDNVDISALWMDGQTMSPSGSGMYGLGTGRVGISPYTAYRFNGNLYCIRLYSRALTAAEVAANYAIDAARFNLP